MDAFDADAVIYAGIPGHLLGRRVRALLAPVEVGDGVTAGCGSVLLLTEVLIKPERLALTRELRALEELLARLDLLACTAEIARLAVSLGAKHALRSIDAVHLATAVQAGADRFITNNSSDFPKSIAEIDITYPADLPEPEH